MRTISVYQLLSKFRRDSGFNVEESDFIEWVGEALQAIGTAQSLEECVALIDVKNHECLIPSGLNYIVQIAINNCKGVTPVQVVESVQSDNEAGQPVPLDCDGSPLTDYDLAYYRPYFDLIYEYQGWTSAPIYNQCFTPVRLADHSFFNSIVCQETVSDLVNLYRSSVYEYTVRDPYLRFSFKEGQIALSYLRVKVDDLGFPLVPDHYSVNEAMTRYVRYKLLQKQYDISDAPAVERKYLKAEQDWQWYCGQAGSYLMMPKTIDDMEDLTQQRSYLLPRQYSYYGFFGKLNQFDKKVYNRFENRMYYRGYNPEIL